MLFLELLLFFDFLLSVLLSKACYPQTDILKINIILLKRILSNKDIVLEKQYLQISL